MVRFAIISTCSIRIMKKYNYRKENKMNLNSISADGWISFAGSIVGAILTTISILIALWYNRKQLKQQQYALNKPYYDALIESLPSYDIIMTQSDYLSEEDDFGKLLSIDECLHMLEYKLKIETENPGLIELKIEHHKKYINYWNTANKKIEDFMASSYYNIVKSNCNGKVISCYYDFVVAFHNEYYYCGPIIKTELLHANLVRLFEAIQQSRK